MHQNGWTEKNLDANYKLNAKQQKVSWARVGLRHKRWYIMFPNYEFLLNQS